MPVYYVPADSVRVTDSAMPRFEMEQGTVELSKLEPAICEFVSRLGRGPLDSAAVESELERSHGTLALAQWYYAIGLLNRRGFIYRAVVHEGRVLARVRTLHCEYLPSVNSEITVNQCLWVASRFSLLRRDADGLNLSSAVNPHSLNVFDPAVARVFAELSRPVPVTELLTRNLGLSRLAVAQTLQIFAEIGIADRCGNGVDADCDCSHSLKFWQFHDALFHASSRFGLNTDPVGATWRFLDNDSLPSLHTPPAGPQIPCLASRDVKTTQPHSQRDFGKQPLDFDRLCTFLYEVGRLTEIRKSGFTLESRHFKWPTHVRPWPNGGGMYELELYVQAIRCKQLDPALYYYDPGKHSLVKTRTDPQHSSSTILDACGAMNITNPPQALVVIGASFPRVMWKYSGSAYALILKNAGVLISEMYHTAARQGLKGCAIGAGDSMEFARNAGFHWSTFTSVGEFALGE